MVLPDLHASLSDESTNVHASFSDESTNVLSLNSSNESLADRDFLNAHSINDSFEILSINVGGLQKRLHGPDFEHFIQNFSLICIQETRFDCFDSIDIQGFKPLPFMIRHRAKYRSGGIAILVKDEYFDKVKVLKNSGENFYWFTLLNCFTVNILFCVIYIPPEGSIYSNIDIFDTLESDLTELILIMTSRYVSWVILIPIQIMTVTVFY